MNFLSEKTERMPAITATMDFIIELGEEDKKNFLKKVTGLAKAFALCATKQEAQKLATEIVFLAVKSGIMKLIPDGSGKQTTAQIDAQ